MVLQIKTEGRDKFPINIPQIYVNFMKDGVSRKILWGILEVAIFVAKTYDYLRYPFNPSPFDSSC